MIDAAKNTYSYLVCAAVLALLASMTAAAQTLATFTVAMPAHSSGCAIPVHVDLDQRIFAADSVLSLVEVRGKTSFDVPFQIEHAGRRILHWFIRPDARSHRSLSFALVRKAPRKYPHIDVAIGDSALVITAGSRNLLRYNFATVYPPPGVDTAFKRSGFIHPLWTPRGQVLTRIQPSDHYHHFGIWNPWTHVLFRGDTVDFWNIGDRKGTVRFAKFLSVASGAVYAEYKALHEHVVFAIRGGEQLALNEVQTVRVHRPDDGADYYIVDLTFTMTCATTDPVKLLEYRYGGLGWRATEQWTNTNSSVLTSEGRIRKDADGSTARWCVVQGALDTVHGGIVMMSFPTNYNHPEPLRIWPETQNGRGDMFANFSPTKNRDWLLEPGRHYVLNYRLLVFNGEYTKDKAERAWREYAAQPRITITLPQ